MKSVRRVHSHRPEYSEYKTGGFLGALLGAILWLGAIIVFLFVAYVSWFQRSLAGLIEIFTQQPTTVPFWFGAILTIVIFPATLAIILIRELVRIIKD